MRGMNGCLSNAGADGIGGWAHMCAPAAEGASSEFEAELAPAFQCGHLGGDADLLEVPPLGQRVQVGPREPVVRRGTPLLERRLVHGRGIAGVGGEAEVGELPCSSAIIASLRTLAITEAAATATQDWSPLMTVRTCQGNPR